MTREEIKQEILNLPKGNLLLEFATGTGKSRIAIERIKQLSLEKDCSQTILIVVPRNPLKKNWKGEFEKWWPECTHPVIYTTYASLHKWADKWDFVIFDECHHLSERCKALLRGFKIDVSILLSATVKQQLKKDLKYLFPGIVFCKRGLRTVIEDDILPDPRVYLWPLSLDTQNYTEVIIKNKSLKTRPIECNWNDRWKYIKQKLNPVIIHCTERQYLLDMNNQIKYWKNRYLSTKSQIAKNKWLRLCGDRLNWLSDKKVPLVQPLLKDLKNYRTLTFCNSIEQTEVLGKHCINSKNKKSSEYLDMFNNRKIKHITACNMLNEGMNLDSCQIGIYVNLNSSDTIVKQRAGRLLRHPNPIIIIPYYKDTREEELMQNMLEDYNPELVTIIKDINDIKT